MSQLIPIPINPPPGVVVTESQRAAEGRWILPFDKIRFVHGRPQKIGGNTRVTTTPMAGTPRATLCWQDFFQNGYISCGTDSKLYALDNTFALVDITPIRATGTLPSNPFTFTSGSNQVAVTLNAHGVLNGDTVYFSGATTNTAVTGSSSGTGGVVRLAVTSSNGMTTGDINVVVSGVGGTTEANGTWTITVVDATHIELQGTTWVNAWTSGGTVADPFTYGINLNGVVTPPSNAFLCSTVTSVSVFNVTAPNTATGSGAGGGSAVSYTFEISTGTELGVFGQGWGTGSWGIGTWGTSRGNSTIFFEPRVWSLDHFGDIEVASYNGGSLWFFDPTQAKPWSRAVATFNGLTVNGAPQNSIRATFVSPERFIFALSANMVVNVCSQGDPTIWTPATSNTAFARTLQFGTKLVDGIPIAPFISLVWSDSAVYLFQYTGSQFLYNSSVAGVDCGLVSPNAAISVDGIAYWMGPDNFYSYNGSVAPVPNVEDIRKYVFEAMSPSTAFQATAVYVAKYHEIWWFYTTTGNTNPSAYAIYHINDQIWSVGAANFYSSVGVTAGRASGSHFAAGDTSPYMAGTDGFLYNHDGVKITYDDNGNPLTWTLTLSPYALNEGLQSVDLEAIEFDFFQQIGNITCTVNTFDRLTDLTVQDTETEIYPAAQGGLTDFRLAGRYVGLGMSSSDPGNYMRLGRPRAFVRPTAKRR